CAHGLDARLGGLEAVIGPLSPVLKLLWREVGGIALVDLDGYAHTAFWNEHGVRGANCSCDGVFVYAADDAWVDFELDEHAEYAALPDDELHLVGPFALTLSPDSFHKDNFSGGAPYSIQPGEGWAPEWRDFDWVGAEVPASASPGPPD